MPHALRFAGSGPDRGGGVEGLIARTRSTIVGTIGVCASRQSWRGPRDSPGSDRKAPVVRVVASHLNQTADGPRKRDEGLRWGKLPLDAHSLTRSPQVHSSTDAHFDPRPSTSLDNNTCKSMNDESFMLTLALGHRGRNARKGGVQRGSKPLRPTADGTRTAQDDRPPLPLTLGAAPIRRS